jgi:hypothetical protein
LQKRKEREEVTVNEYKNHLEEIEELLGEVNKDQQHASTVIKEEETVSVT